MKKLLSQILFISIFMIFLAKTPYILASSSPDKQGGNMTELSPEEVRKVVRKRTFTRSQQDQLSEKEKDDLVASGKKMRLPAKDFPTLAMEESQPPTLSLRYQSPQDFSSSALRFEGIDPYFVLGESTPCERLSGQLRDLSQQTDSELIPEKLQVAQIFLLKEKEIENEQRRISNQLQFQKSALDKKKVSGDPSQTGQPDYALQIRLLREKLVSLEVDRQDLHSKLESALSENASLQRGVVELKNSQVQSFEMLTQNHQLELQQAHEKEKKSQKVIKILLSILSSSNNSQQFEEMINMIPTSSIPALNSPTGTVQQLAGYYRQSCPIISPNPSIHLSPTSSSDVTYPYFNSSPFIPNSFQKH